MLGTLDDDETSVGANRGYPFVSYVLADVADRDTVVAACNLFRTITVGDGPYRLWRYCQVDARMGRPLDIPLDCA